MLPDHSLTKNPLLVVIAGPTAVGKTSLSIQLARQLETEIISCDSRQFYSEMRIGTAVPAIEDLAAVKHHFIGFLSITDSYDVSRYETDALACLNGLFQKHRVVIMTGGSGLYINAVCRGFDDLPDGDPKIRKVLQETFKINGLEALQEKLRLLDPEYYEMVDKKNPNRLLRAIEVCMISGRPYSQLRKGMIRERPFRVLKIALNRSRTELFERISLRTRQMISAGLVEEAKSLICYRDKNALNTVGYKEIFDYFDGKSSLDLAIENIMTNTRRYAKRQLTWLKKDQEYHWFEPEQYQQILSLIEVNLC